MTPPTRDDRAGSNAPDDASHPNDRESLLIRPAIPADNARCQEIAVAAWEPIYASSRAALGDEIFQHLHPDGLASKARQIAAAFTGHIDWILVACVCAQGTEPDGAATGPHQIAPEQIVGFATFRLDRERKVGEIGNNAVDPAWRGRGIAGALYERVLDRFRREGMTIARVTTGLDDAHAPARAAYKKIGFERGTTSITYYRTL